METRGTATEAGAVTAASTNSSPPAPASDLLDSQSPNGSHRPAATKTFPWRLASRRRRLASLGYEAFLLVAVLFVAGFMLVPISQAAPPAVQRLFLQLTLSVVAGVYCVVCWRKGHTLAMKAWGITLKLADGSALDRRTAVVRFLWALPGTLLAGVGFLWCLVDREGQFLHDRLAGTRLFDATASTPLETRDHEHAHSQEH